MSLADELEKLRALRADGILSDEEFEQEKTRLLRERELTFGQILREEGV